MIDTPRSWLILKTFLLKSSFFWTSYWKSNHPFVHTSFLLLVPNSVSGLPHPVPRPSCHHQSGNVVSGKQPLIDLRWQKLVFGLQPHQSRAREVVVLITSLSSKEYFSNYFHGLVIINFVRDLKKNIAM